MGRWIERRFVQSNHRWGRLRKTNTTAAAAAAAYLAQQLTQFCPRLRFTQIRMSRRRLMNRLKNSRWRRSLRDTTAERRHWNIVVIAVVVVVEFLRRRCQGETLLLFRRAYREWGNWDWRVVISERFVSWARWWGLESWSTRWENS